MPPHRPAPTRRGASARPNDQFHKPQTNLWYRHWAGDHPEVAPQFEDTPIVSVTRDDQQNNWTARLAFKKLGTTQSHMSRETYPYFPLAAARESPPEAWLSHDFATQEHTSRSTAARSTSSAASTATWASDSLPQQGGIAAALLGGADDAAAPTRPPRGRTHHDTPLGEYNGSKPLVGKATRRGVGCRGGGGRGAGRDVGIGGAPRLRVPTPDTTPLVSAVRAAPILQEKGLQSEMQQELHMGSTADLRVQQQFQQQQQQQQQQQLQQHQHQQQSTRETAAAARQAPLPQAPLSPPKHRAAPTRQSSSSSGIGDVDGDGGSGGAGGGKGRGCAAAGGGGKLYGSRGVGGRVSGQGGRPGAVGAGLRDPRAAPGADLLGDQVSACMHGGKAVGGATREMLAAPSHGGDAASALIDRLSTARADNDANLYRNSSGQLTRNSSGIGVYIGGGCSSTPGQQQQHRGPPPPLPNRRPSSAGSQNSHYSQYSLASTLLEEWQGEPEWQPLSEHSTGRRARPLGSGAQATTARESLGEQKRLEVRRATHRHGRALSPTRCQAI